MGGIGNTHARVYQDLKDMTKIVAVCDIIKERADKAAEFERLKSFLTADKNAIPYPAVADELGMSESALRVAVYRLRKRYRELFREEIAHTLAEGEDVDEELRHLLTVLSK